eukprot:2329498-Rhodomonas_salina.1
MQMNSASPWLFCAGLLCRATMLCLPIQPTAWEAQSNFPTFAFVLALKFELSSVNSTTVNATPEHFPKAQTVTLPLMLPPGADFVNFLINFCSLSTGASTFRLDFSRCTGGRLGTSRSRETSLYGLHSPYKLDFGFWLSSRAAEALATTPAGCVLPVALASNLSPPTRLMPPRAPTKHQAQAGRPTSSPSSLPAASSPPFVAF